MSPGRRSEPTPKDFLDALIAATREMVRVLKPSGSIFVNLGDSYAGSGGYNNSNISSKQRGPASYRWNGRGRSRDGAVAEWTEANAAWLAGVIDSDGSISVHRNHAKPHHAVSFVPWCRIGQMTEQAVHEARCITGVGKVFQDKRGVWNWHVASQQARYVLERTWPYLRIKQRQALAAIELARTISDYGASGTRAVGFDEFIPGGLLVRRALGDVTRVPRTGLQATSSVLRSLDVGLWASSVQNAKEATKDTALRREAWAALTNLSEPGADSSSIG